MFKALLMAFGMFTIFPVPRNHWDDRAVPWVAIFLPLVGAAIGAVWYAVAWAMVLPVMLQAVAVLLVPFVLSGFLHVDGYMDAADAVFSRRELAEKKRILKDPHVGAFAVIAVGCLLLVDFAASQTILSEKKAILGFALIPIVSRCVVGWLMLTLKPMSETGLMSMFRRETGFRHKAILIFCLIIIMTATITVGRMQIFVPAFAVVAGMTLTSLYTYRQFQGFSGDLCGCSLVVGETCGMLAMAIM